MPDPEDSVDESADEYVADDADTDADTGQHHRAAGRPEAAEPWAEYGRYPDEGFPTGGDLYADEDPYPADETFATGTAGWASGSVATAATAGAAASASG